MQILYLLHVRARTCCSIHGGLGIPTIMHLSEPPTAAVPPTYSLQACEHGPLRPSCGRRIGLLRIACPLALTNASLLQSRLRLAAVGPEGQPAWTKKKVAFRLTRMWGFCKGFLLLKTNQWTKENEISYSFRRTPLDNINMKQTHFALPGKRPPMSRSCRHGCGVCVRLHTLPRSLRALPPSNVVCCACCSSAPGCHDGHCHDLNIGGGGAARNTTVSDNMGPLINEYTGGKLQKAFRLISSRGVCMLAIGTVLVTNVGTCTKPDSQFSPSSSGATFFIISQCPSMPMPRLSTPLTSQLTPPRQQYDSYTK